MFYPTASEVKGLVNQDHRVCHLQQSKHSMLLKGYIYSLSHEVSSFEGTPRQHLIKFFINSSERGEEEIAKKSMIQDITDEPERVDLEPEL